MKASILTTVLLALVCFLIVAEKARAQIDGTPEGPSIDGYTSIDYDPDTNTVTAYSETDIPHYGVRSVYDAYVYMSVTNDSGAILASDIGRDYTHIGFTSVTVQVAGDPTTTYTANATHKARTRLYDEYYQDFYPYRYIIDYWDDYFFGFFEGQYINEPWFYHFFRPGTDPVTRRSPYINLGNTYDSASVTTPLRTPHHLQVVNDNYDPNGNGCGGLSRKITYRVVDVSGNPVGNISIIEDFGGTVYDSCNGKNINTTSTCRHYVSADGTFIDNLSTGCPSLTGTCGAEATDHWQWCRRRDGAHITLATIDYRVHYNYITANGLERFDVGTELFP